MFSEVKFCLKCLIVWRYWPNINYSVLRFDGVFLQLTFYWSEVQVTVLLIYKQTG